MYDEIASVYHLVYPNWDDAIREQSSNLDAVFRERVGPPPLSVLDVSCGIGTQALGLAALGHRVAASDLSARAVARAREEAARRSLVIDFRVGDMRSAHELHAGPFDVVLSADNAVPHLLTDEAISEAFRSFCRCLRPGGAAVVTVRDYWPDEDRSSPQLVPYGFRSDGDDRYFVIQTRDWHGDAYDVAMYFIREARGNEPAQVVAGASRYRAVTTARLEELFREAGFAKTERLDGRYFSPVIVARKPGGPTRGST